MADDRNENPDNDNKTAVNETREGDNKKEEKKASQRAANAVDKGKKIKQFVDWAKSVEALAPIVTVVAIIAAIIVIVILIIGFIGFFITLPGLAVSQFLDTCKSFWDEVTGNEAIEIKEEQLVNLANYIEDLGYDIEGFGFATANSVQREGDETASIDEGEGTNQTEKSTKKGKITGIQLETDVNFTEQEINMMGSFDYLNDNGDNTKPLNKVNDYLYLPRDILKDATIIRYNNNYYKMVDGNGNKVSIMNDNGQLKKMTITFDSSDGHPIFTENNGEEKSLEDQFRENKISIEYVSFDDYKKRKIGGYYTDNNALQVQNLKGICTYIIQFLELTTTIKDSKLLPSNSNIHSIKNLGISPSGNNEQDTLKYIEFMLNHDEAVSGIEYSNLSHPEIIKKIIDKYNEQGADNNEKFKMQQEVMDTFYNATGDLLDLKVKIKDQLSIKRKNLYAYVISNERTYTAVGTKTDFIEGFENTGIRTTLVGWIPGMKTLEKHFILWLDETLKQPFVNSFPQGFGMIRFPNEAWEFGEDAASVKKGDFSVYIDREKETMNIITSKSTGIFSAKNEEMAWKLSGWTSRYGKPIELSLALHLSTMAPQFVYDFCMDKDLQTEVTVKAHKIKYNVDYSYQKKKGENEKYQAFYKNDKTVINTETNEERTEKGIISTYEDLQEYLPHYYRLKNLFTKSNHLKREPAFYTAENGYEAPVQFPIDVITNNTSIISIEDENGSKEYYKAVDMDGNPISFNFNQDVQPYPGYYINFVNGEPRFIASNDPNYPGFNIWAPYFITYSPTLEIMNTNKKVTLEVLGFRDYTTLLNNSISDGLAQSLFIRRSLWEDFKLSLKKDTEQDCIYTFAKYGKYSNILSQYDIFINDTLPNVILNQSNEKRIFSDSEIENIKSKIFLKNIFVNEKNQELQSDYYNNPTLKHYMDCGFIYEYIDKSRDTNEYIVGNDAYFDYVDAQFVSHFYNIVVKDITIEEKSHSFKSFFSKLVGGEENEEYANYIYRKFIGNRTRVPFVEIFYYSMINTGLNSSHTLEQTIKDEYGTISNAVNSIIKEENNMYDVPTQYDVLDYTAKKIVEDEMQRLRKYGISSEDISELATLYAAFKDLSDEVETYKPYIESVKHHWYRDIEFGNPEDKNESNKDSLVYERVTSKTKKTGEFSPSEGAIAYDEINALKKDAEVNYTLTLAEGYSDIRQINNPKINTTEEWHYKVKNWLVYGYYFIYDGSTKTAKEIEDARKYLESLNVGFNEENPLLTNDFDSKEAQINLFNSGTNASKIDQRAKDYNDLLRRAGKPARLQKIKFDKTSSLAAFSILEGMHTEDSEYIYRELKEFLIELNYFTRADFEVMEKGVLKWLIPRYAVYKDEWPDINFEKCKDQYGAFVRSTASLTDQRKAEAESKKKDGGTSTTLSSVTPTDNKPITVNGITFANYKQGGQPWSSDPFSAGNIGSSGCGPTSAATLLSGYGYNDLTPRELAATIDASDSPFRTNDTCRAALRYAIEKLTNGNVKMSETYTLTEENKTSVLKKALEEGRPVIVGTSLTGSGHIICLLGMDAEGKVYCSDPMQVERAPIPFDDIFSNWGIDVGVSGYTVALDIPTGYTGTRSNQRGALKGFSPNLSVIAPENAKIIEIGENKNAKKRSDIGKDNQANNTSNSQNNNNSQTNNTSNNNQTTGENEETKYNPDDYFTTNGKYIILEFKTGNAVNGWKMQIEGLNINEELKENQYIKQKAEIGKTTDDNIRIVLYDDKDAIINDVEDYFKLRKRNNGEIDEDMYAFFFFSLYETANGGTINDENCGPESVGACEKGVEHGVGICQWTTMEGCNNIEYICSKLYEKDPDLCAPLQKYIGKSVQEIIYYGTHPGFPESELRKDFKDICSVDREAFLQLQMEIAYEDFMKTFDELGLTWIKDRPFIVQGTLASLVNWGPALGWENAINPDMDDEEIIIALNRYACGFKSTQGPLNTRWNSQAKAALDILDGTISAEEFLTDRNVSAPYTTYGIYTNFLSEYD